MQVSKKLGLVILLLGLLPESPCHAQFNDQLPSSSTAIFLEIGGYALLYSVNLDHIVFEHGLNKIAARVGYGYFEGSLVPLGVSYLRGSDGNYVELGAGYVPYFPKKTNTPNSAHSSFRLAYRYQHEDGGLFFIFGPGYSTVKNLGSTPVPGKLSISFAIGYTLRPRF